MICILASHWNKETALTQMESIRPHLSALNFGPSRGWFYMVRILSSVPYRHIFLRSVMLPYLLECKNQFNIINYTSISHLHQSISHFSISHDIPLSIWPLSKEFVLWCLSYIQLITYVFLFKNKIHLNISAKLPLIFMAPKNAAWIGQTFAFNSDLSSPLCICNTFSPEWEVCSWWGAQNYISIPDVA